MSDLAMFNWESMFRLFVAALLGAVIGWEREQRNKQAGLKTHLLVSVGSALIMLLSIYGFSDFNDHPNARFDPARLAAQVVSGIGFIGAGAILRQSNMIISGLTTAATLWVVAAIGLSVGAGYYIPAVVTVFLVLVMMYLVRKIETRMIRGDQHRGLTLILKDQPGMLGQIASKLGEEGVNIRKINISDEDYDDGYIEIDLQLSFSQRVDVVGVIEKLKGIDGVRRIQYDE